MQQKFYSFKNAIITLIFLIISTISFAQKGIIAGILKENINNGVLNGATIRLVGQSDSLFKKITQTDTAGFFTFTRIPKGVYALKLSYVGFTPKTIAQITVKDSLINLGKVYLEKIPKQGNDVVIVVKPTVSQKGDTIIYNASEFKTNPDATVEDLVKKMPGITIENGVVKAQGEDVKKVTIDGKDFFGDDASAALKNLPADIVDKIQVFDRLSDQAQFSGFDDGNSQKSINVVTKSGLKNGQFGRMFAGAGTKETYSAGGNVSFFKGDRRISIIGQANNINQQNFSAQDILGLTGNTMSGGGGRGGMGGGAQGGGGGRSGMGGGGFTGGGRSGGGGGFFVGQQNGINSTNAIGININDVWGKKLTVSGSYFFNNTNNNTDQFTNQQTFLNADSSLFYKENNLSSSNNYNHRFNLRFEYKIDSANTLMITPSMSFQNNKSFAELDGLTSYNPLSKISDQLNTNNRKTNGFNLGNNIMYRHAFKKRGRTISISLNTSGNNRVGETFIENRNIYYRPFGTLKDSLNQFTDILTNGYTIGANISYTEPIAKDGQLQISYNPSYNKNKSDQEAFKYDYTGDKYSIFDQNLSNKFDNTYSTNNAGVTFRKGNRDKMFSLGLAMQYATLSSNQVYPITTTVNRNFFNLLPEASWNRKLSAKSSIRLNFRTNTNAPGITQLQNVINNNNPLFISTGNPDLKQQVSQMLTTRYTFTNTARNQSLFANIFLQKNSNYISNATTIASKDSALNSSVTLYKGSQLSKPVNLDGYWSARTFLTFGQMIKSIKTNINFNAGFGYTNTPGIVNGVSNTAKSYNYNTGITLSSNVSQYIDYNLSYTANFNTVDNSIQPQLNNKFFTQVASLQFNLLNKKGWFFQNDINNQTYKGLADGFNQSFWLWNMGLGKKFLKDQKGELKISVFDLLKQNQSISRTITESGITDVQNQVLTQYFMLTFTYKLKNFGTAKPVSNPFSGQGDFRRMNMPGF